MKNKILLVDDEEGIRKVLGLSLADSGYEVTTAGSGEEALSLFRETNPQIVLTDIKMPGMDGIELLRKIKEQKPETEVIMITGHGDLELAIRSLQFEAADFITKPINDDALEIALKRAHEKIWMKAKLQEYTEGLELLVYEKTQKLLEAERLAAIGQTVATLAHAIKNIIGGLKGGLYVVEKGMELGKEEYLSQGWEMLKGNVEKIKNLALDLLNYAKEREPELRLCDPNEPIREVYQLMLSRAHECGIRLTLDLAPDLAATLLDPEALHCSLLNLATNALDACIDIGCLCDEKEVCLRTCKTRGWAVEYQVADNGCGIDDDAKSRVFRNFFSTKGTKGTGLGLMITQKIVRAHGGEIELRSEKGKGTTFIIRLPQISAQGGV
jgi:signal transduction histidine kinase